MRYIWCVAFLIALCGGALASTYYVSASGNNANSGLSWAQAWRNLDSLRAKTNGGDTIFMGTLTCTLGVNSTRLALDSGSASDWTVLACSSFADTNANGQYHFAKIYNGQPLSGWEVYSGNVYKAYFTAADNGNLCQNDSMLILETSLANVNASGEFYIQGDSIYAYVWNLGSGYDPDNYNMWIAWRTTLQVTDSISGDTISMTRRLSYVHIYGIEFKYAADAHIRMIQKSGRHVKIEKCKFWMVNTRVRSLDNPCAIHNGLSDVKMFDWEIKACSIGMSECHSGSTHGTGITLYEGNNIIIDSCTFWGWFNADAVQFKSNVDSSVVRNCLFTARCANAIKFYQDCSYDSAYFNTIKNNVTSAFYIAPYSASAQSNNAYILFNTVVGNVSFLYHSTNPEAKGWDSVKIKYNVYYWPQENASRNVSLGVHAYDTVNARYWVIDSSAYCLHDTTRFFVHTAAYNWSQWRSGNIAFDTHTDLYSNLAGLNFVNYPDDLHRNIEGTEVNNIVIGGVVCTKYGAYQDAQTQKKKFLRMLAR